VSQKNEGANHAIWQDPSTYDPMLHGPPFLRTMGAMVRQAATQKTATLLEGLLGELENPSNWLSVTIAFMRSCGLVHQTHHWQTRGPSYYADHTLFERLYDESQEMIDTLAEKAVAFRQHPVVDPLRQVSLIGKIVPYLYEGTSDGGSDAYPGISLRAELRLLVLLKLVYKRLEGAQCLTMGLDNLLQDIADQHEQFVYLLQQRVVSSGGARQAAVDPWKAWAK